VEEVEVADMEVVEVADMEVEVEVADMEVEVVVDMEVEVEGDMAGVDIGEGIGEATVEQGAGDGIGYGPAAFLWQSQRSLHLN